MLLDTNRGETKNQRKKKKVVRTERNLRFLSSPKPILIFSFRIKSPFSSYWCVLSLIYIVWTSGLNRWFGKHFVINNNLYWFDIILLCPLTLQKWFLRLHRWTGLIAKLCTSTSVWTGLITELLMSTCVAHPKANWTW